MAMDEFKTEIEEIKALVSQVRDKFEEAKKGFIPVSEFKEFQEKVEAKIAELETKVTRPAVTTKQGEMESPQMKAFMAFLRKGELEPEEKKVLTISDDTTGGYLAPSEYVNQIIADLTELSPIRQYAWVRPTGGKSAMIPKKAGTIVAKWTSEIGTVEEDVTLRFGMEDVKAHQLTALVIVSKEDLEDTSFNLENYLKQEIVEQIGAAEGKAFVTGDGVGKPEGILANKDVAEVVTGDATSITADAIVALPYELKSGYLKNAAYFLNRQTLKQIRLLKDNQGQYLWQPDYRAGQPGTLNGFPVVETPDMPDVAANAYPVFFGDLKRGYVIVDRLAVEFQRLVEKYAVYGQIGILARKRTGGQVVNPKAIVKLKVAA